MHSTMTSSLSPQYIITEKTALHLRYSYPVPMRKMPTKKVSPNMNNKFIRF